jgi:hypothetical protein
VEKDVFASNAKSQFCRKYRSLDTGGDGDEGDGGDDGGERIL